MLAPFSSRGPTYDGRIKPDIVVPGHKIISQRASASGGSAIGQVQINTVSTSGVAVVDTRAAGFGPSLGASSLDWSLNYTLTASRSGQNSEACEALTGDLTGQIALISRGSCYFLDKVYHAQLAGAVAVVVYNNLDDAALIRMSAASSADFGPESITIPSYFISKESRELWPGVSESAVAAVVRLTQSGADAVLLALIKPSVDVIVVSRLWI